MRIVSALAAALVLASATALAATPAKSTKPAKDAKSSGKTGGKTTAGAKKKLTRADLEAAKEGVKPFQPWDETFARVQAKLGAPTAIDGTQNLWYVKDGDKCVELLLDKMNDQVGTAGISEYDKDMAEQYAKCDAK